MRTETTGSPSGVSVGDVVHVSRDERTSFDDPPDLDVFDAVVTFVGKGGVVVRRGAKGRGRRDVVAYADLRGQTGDR